MTEGHLKLSLGPADDQLHDYYIQLQFSHL